MIWFLQIKSSLSQCDKTENINVTRGFNAEVITGHLFKFCYQLLLRWDCLISKHKTKDRVSPYMTASADSSGLGLEGYLWHRFKRCWTKRFGLYLSHSRFVSRACTMEICCSISFPRCHCPRIFDSRLLHFLSVLDSFWFWPWSSVFGLS